MQFLVHQFQSNESICSICTVSILREKDANFNGAPYDPVNEADAMFYPQGPTSQRAQYNTRLLFSDL